MTTVLMTAQPYVQRQLMTVTAMQWHPSDLTAACAVIGWLLAVGARFEADMNTRSGKPATLRLPGHPATPGPGWWIARRDHDAFVYPLPPDTFAERFAPAGEVNPYRDRDDLAALLVEVLGHFTQRGNPGVACTRTPWVRDTTVASWRARLAGIVPPADLDGGDERG